MWRTTQQTFTYSKSTIETLEKAVEYIQSQQQQHWNDVNEVALMFLLLPVNIFYTFFSVLLLTDSEEVIVSWERTTQVSSKANNFRSSRRTEKL